MSIKSMYQYNRARTGDTPVRRAKVAEPYMLFCCTDTMLPPNARHKRDESLAADGSEGGSDAPKWECRGGRPEGRSAAQVGRKEEERDQ